MKNLSLLLISGLFLFFLQSCGGVSQGNGNDETRMNVEEFLSHLDISIFEGSEIISTESDEIKTFVPAETASPEEIMGYYIPKVEEALTDRDPWVRQIKAATTIQYRRGYTGWNFGIILNPEKRDGGYEVSIIYNRL